VPAPHPGLREHFRPLLGSVVLHLAIAVGLGVAALFRFAPETPAVKTIQAYVVRAPETVQRPPQAAVPEPAPEAPPAPTPEPEPQPEPEPEREVDPAPAPKPPQPDPAVERAAEQRRAAEAKKADDARKAEAAAVAKRKAEQQAEERRRFEAQAKARAETEAKKKAEAESRRKAEAEARRKADADARRKAEAELAERASREADLDRQLAAEGRRQDPTLMNRYVADITASIQRSWNRPPTARPGLKCTVYVTQVPGGAVTEATVGTCNGDEAVRQSIVSAVLRASPLPAPPDPSLFARKLELVFQPDE
jgi:colicin import membrane protein